MATVPYIYPSPNIFFFSSFHPLNHTVACLVYVEWTAAQLVRSSNTSSFSCSRGWRAAIALKTTKVILWILMDKEVGWLFKCLHWRPQQQVVWLQRVQRTWGPHWWYGEDQCRLRNQERWWTRSLYQRLIFRSLESCKWSPTPNSGQCLWIGVGGYYKPRLWLDKRYSSVALVQSEGTIWPTTMLWLANTISCLLIAHPFSPVNFAPAI